MNKLDKNSMIVASNNQISVDLSSNEIESAIILNLQDGVYYELKNVGTFVWNLIQQPCSIRSILDALLEEYEVDLEQCEVDLFALAEDLAKHGLIKIQ